MKPSIRQGWYVLGLLFALFANGCGSQDDPQPALRNGITITDSLQASFEVLDMDGNPQASFKEGQNFQLSFRIQNRGNTPVYIEPWVFPTTKREFFAVTKLNTEENSPQFIGKPFDAVGGAYDLTAQIIPAKTVITYQIPWQTQLAKPYEMPVYDPQVPDRLQRFYSRQKEPVQVLTKGSYQSSFTLDITGRQITFSVAFTIE